jgi:hypothetical protein
MPADVDIIVTSPDSTEIRLIAEAKLSLPDITSAEKALKLAMLRMASPVGLLVTPEKMWVYVDRYVSQSPESVDRVAEFDISKFLSFKPSSLSSDEAQQFENVVQNWLEALPGHAQRMPRNGNHFWKIVTTYIVPALESGEIRAAAPRYRN